MGKTLRVRLKAYKPNGELLGLLPEPVSFDASFEHNDSGTLKVKYSRKAFNGSIFQRSLGEGLTIGLEVSDGGAWREPYNARFVLVSRSRDAQDQSDTLDLNLMTYAWLLKKALLLDTSRLEKEGTNKGKRAFLSANPGSIIKTMLTENKERGGVAQYVPLGFDAGVDAAGVKWARVMSLHYDPGVDAYTALSNLAANGVVDWRTQGMSLKLWNADSPHLCHDYSNQIILPLATQMLESPEEETIEDLASHILVMGDGMNFVQDNPSAPTPWGKWELYSSQGGVSDPATARTLMTQQLDQAARIRGQYTRTVMTANVEWLPLVDYQAGDWITAPTVSHGEKVRVQRISVSLSTSGLKVALILNDRLYDAQTRQAKRVQGITGGAVQGGAQGGRPAPEQDHRQPAKPRDLQLISDAYIDPYGYPKGSLTATWQAVERATDDSIIDIAHYEVQYKAADANDWKFAALTDKTSQAIDSLPIGALIQVRVRAIPQHSDAKGLWCDPAEITISKDLTPPSTPAAPTVASQLGVVHITSQWLTADGGKLEPDTDHLEVGRGLASGQAQVIGSIGRTSPQLTDYQVEEKRTYYYSLRAVDRTGNKSNWSASTPITVGAYTHPERVEQIEQEAKAARTGLEQFQRDVSQTYETKQDALESHTTLTQNLDGFKTTVSQTYTSKEDFSNLSDTVEQNNASISEQLQSQIDQAKDEINTFVSENYYSLTDAEQLMAQMQTQFTQTSDDFTFKFNEIQTALGALSGDVNSSITNINKYIRFVDGHIIIGVEGNPFSLDIGNDRISFLQYNSEIAYMSNHQLYIASGVITEHLQIGVFEFRPRSNGNLSLVLAKQ